MSKSILIVDTPEQVCQKCKLCYESNCGNFMCAGTGRIIPDGEKPDWCPLKDVPVKRLFNEELVRGITVRERINKALHEAASLGWNACIDEILKECD